jgi:hypothetical protein
MSADTKVTLIDQSGSEVAKLDLPLLPRKDDVLEFGSHFFTVWRVVHKRIELPSHETRVVEGVPVSCRVDRPWKWVLHGFFG